jgi:hypothetical protein
VPSALHQWFTDQIETFAPPTLHAARQQLYATLATLQPEEGTPLYDDVVLFILAQIVMARQLEKPGPGTAETGRRSAHMTWYEKERQRIAKLLRQIADSPIVAACVTTVAYYEAHAVTCPHGRNTKTCEELYVLRLTLQLLERHQNHGVHRKHLERLRQREPHLPELQELCRPPVSARVAVDDTRTIPATSETVSRSIRPVDELTTYLMGTIVGRLRHLGWSMAQSCTLVDRILSSCFERPDMHGNRVEQLVEQWRRFNASAG